MNYIYDSEKFSALQGCTKATDLGYLASKRCLKVEGIGRDRHYF